MKTFSIALCLILAVCKLNAREIPQLAMKEGTITQDDSAIVISEEEIKRAMHFGATEKVASIIMGSFEGFLIGGGTGALITRTGSGKIKGEPSGGSIEGILYGGGVGLVSGAFINYAIVRALSKKDAKRRLIEARMKKSTADRQIIINILIGSGPNQLRSAAINSNYYAIGLQISL